MGEFGFRALTSEDWAAADAPSISGLDNNGALKLKSIDGSYEKDGLYTPDLFSSGIPGCRWHRIVIDADIPRNSRLDVTIYTSDSKKSLADPAILSNLPSRVYTFANNVSDLLIQSGTGEWIKLALGFHGDGKETPELRQLKIYYPRLSYLRYLPAIYQEDEKSRDFLERFLSVFETKLFESEETISNLPIYFDPMAAPDDFLEWLASWLALDRYELLGERNRDFILRAAAEFYRQKGTASGLASLVSFLTGGECCIKEYMNNVFRTYGREHLEAEEIKGEGHCQSFFHDLSKTVDTDPQHDMISNKNSYLDRIHYTFDSGKYSTHGVGLFIFLKPGETLQITDDELKKIIENFVPVFTQVFITTIEFFEESYPLTGISDSFLPYNDLVHDSFNEQFTGGEGNYVDTASFLWLITNKKGKPGEWIANNTAYRTVHSKLGKSIPI